LTALAIREVELVATVADHRDGPHRPLPRVAFAGRSNVGKSSLLNSLFGRAIARTSKEPGKTRTLNYYLVNGACFFVDLPGYGFARVAMAERRSWGKRITAFLEEEPRLALVVGLIDPRVPTSPLDLDLAALVRSAGRPLLAVLTKTDCVRPGELARAADRLRRDLELDARPLPFSARTGKGKREILTAIAGALAA
jgi:GTP-binding protein